MTTNAPFGTGKFLTLLLGALFLQGAPARAVVPSDVESAYSSAVLSFHTKDYSGSLRQLDEVLSRYPKLEEATELKALSLKALGKTNEAILLLKDLLGRKTTEPEEESAYRFELGTLYFRQKAYGDAAPLLTDSIRRKFNVGASHYFLGTIDYLQKHYETSEAHFQSVLDKDSSELKAPTHLYLAELSNVANDRASTVFHYFRARELAALQLADPSRQAEGNELAKLIMASFDKVVGVLDKGSAFFRVGTLAGYDSNVLFTPSGATSPASGPSGRGSLRQFLNAELGYSSSPLKKIQFTPVLRSAWNYNFNRETAAGQYISNDLSLILGYKPLSPLSAGLRLGAVGSFRYTLDPVLGTQRYRTYSLLGVFAPYLKTSLGGRWTLLASLNLSPQRFFLDSETTSQFLKTGTDYSTEILVRQDRGHDLWNPSLALRGVIHYTKGTEFRSRGLEMEAANLFSLSGKSTVSLFVILGSSSFKDRPDGPRFDVNLSGGTGLSYRLSSPVSLFGNLEFQKNNSNVALPYKFSRFVLNLGATYRL